MKNKKNEITYLPHSFKSFKFWFKNMDEYWLKQLVVKCLICRQEISGKTYIRFNNLMNKAQYVDPKKLCAKCEKENPVEAAKLK